MTIEISTTKPTACIKHFISILALLPILNIDFFHKKGAGDLTRAAVCYIHNLCKKELLLQLPMCCYSDKAGECNGLYLQSDYKWFSATAIKFLLKGKVCSTMFLYMLCLQNAVLGILLFLSTAVQI